LRPFRALSPPSRPSATAAAFFFVFAMCNKSHKPGCKPEYNNGAITTLATLAREPVPGFRQREMMEGGEVVPGADGRLEQRFEPDFQLVVAVGGMG
jgi:hypothetical protein